MELLHTAAYSVHRLNSINVNFFFLGRKKQIIDYNLIIYNIYDNMYISENRRRTKKDLFFFFPVKAREKKKKKLYTIYSALSCK